jgi:hypothetical protein
MSETAKRPHPDLLSDAERKALLGDAEWLWRRLEANDIGGYSGINRPFYIVHAFKEVIEKFGRRDVGLTWSQDDLAAAEPAPDLLACLKRLLLEFDFLVEGGHLPDVRNDVIFDDARKAVAASEANKRTI